MAKDTLPIREIASAAISVLRERLAPLEYRTLTDLALTKAGYPPDKREWLNFRRQIEDVREKLLVYDRCERGFMYLGEPWCVGALRSWYKPSPVFDAIDGSIAIPPTPESMRAAIFEAVMRAPYMVDKFGRPSEIRWNALARGYTTEFVIREYFKKQWPMFYREPSNHGQYSTPASDDFQLELGDWRLDVDIMGPRLDGSYGLNPGKKPARYHLIGRMGVNCIYWDAVMRGDQMTDTADISIATSAQSWAARLNTLAIHSDLYRAIRRRAYGFATTT